MCAFLSLTWKDVARKDCSNIWTRCVAFGVDSALPPFINEFAYAFALQALGLLILTYLCAFHVTETRYFTENEVVVPTGFVEKEKRIDPEAANREVAAHHQFDDNEKKNNDQFATVRTARSGST